MQCTYVIRDEINADFADTFREHLRVYVRVRRRKKRTRVRRRRGWKIFFSLKRVKIMKIKIEPFAYTVSEERARILRRPEKLLLFIRPNCYLFF